MMRLCPLCGQRTEDARCPADGTATLVLAQNPESRLSEGTEVNGRYRIGKLIGQGGFGAVYRATSLATGNEIAIKVLGVSLANDDSELIQRFYAEAQITAALKHPNTIRVFDFGQTDSGALYIAMELLTGQALNELLRDRRRAGLVLEQHEAVRVAVQTLRSLAEAHVNGLVHRDLKPHNIFLNEVPGDEPVVKVLDFGIAKRLGSNLTGTGQAFGTPAYMSPEQAQNRQIDARSDLYSLGCVIYQCVTGSTPFEGDNPLAVLLSHVTDKPAPLAKAAQTPLSDDFIALIERALAKNPDERFASAQEMRAALERVRPAPAEMPSGRNESVRLDVDLGAGDDERTAAYMPAGSPLPPLSSPPPAPGTSRGGQGLTPPRGPTGSSGHTEAFLLRESGEDDPAAEPAGRGAAKPRSTGLFAALAVVAVLVAGGVGFALFGGGTAAAGDRLAGADGSVAAAVAAPGGAAAADPAATPPDALGKTGGEQVVAAAGSAAGGAVAAAGATAEADGAAASPTDAAPAVPVIAGPVTVEVRSDPDGADLTIDGKVVGQTPRPVLVPAGGQILVTLQKAGFRDVEIVVNASMAPSRVVTLTAAAKAAKPKAAPSPRPRTRPATPSALEERL